MEYFESSSSSSKPIHVYLSFRGDDDTRKFIHRLSAALKSEGLRIFGDDKKLETSDASPPPHLLQAIQQSWICIVVFSKNYASSPWCLQELSQVSRRIVYHLEDRNVPVLKDADPVFPVREERFEADIEKLDQWMLIMKQEAYYSGRADVRYRVIPVFYDVDPSFAEELEEERYTDGDLWGQNMKEVANHVGWVLQNDLRPQATEKIVKDVRTKIDKIFYGFFRFVGMQSRVEEVEKLLDLGSNNVVRVIGICGMGGLGKTTLATVLYLKIFHYFDAFCFLPNVSARLKRGDLSLQELLCENLDTENPEIIRNFLIGGFLACKRSGRRKFLIILDGVDLAQDIEELNLLEKSYYFGGGSRIIITTRDERVLQMSEVDAIYRPELLTKDEALQLFCSEAFQREFPIRGLEEMTCGVLEYADGLPLALLELGLMFRNRSFVEWREALDELKDNPPYTLTWVLQESFDELDDMSKEMFLDIACFFVEKDINYVKEILQDCGFSVEIGITLLIDKSLMTVSKERIQMHAMLQMMGRDIVRQEFPSDPAKQSRLWLFNNIKCVLENNGNTAIEDVEAIVLDLDEPKGATLRIEVLSHMSNLRLLIFRNVNVFGTLNNLSSKLRYISWHEYPFTHLPSSFKSDTLVQLIMPDSNITEVWKGKMMLPNLRNMNLRGSKDLIKTPDFTAVPNLERLDLEDCVGLLQIHPSITKLSKLKFLNLRNCINVVSIPNGLFTLNFLEVLNMTCCTELAYCLKFSPLRSSIEVKLLSDHHYPLLEKVLFLLLFFLPEHRNYLEFVFCCIIYLIYICKV